MLIPGRVALFGAQGRRFCVCVTWTITTAIRYIIRTRFKHRIKLPVSFKCTNNIRFNVKFGPLRDDII